MKALVPEDPEWRTRQPFQAVLEGNVKALAASGEKGMREAHSFGSVADVTGNEECLRGVPPSLLGGEPRFLRRIVSLAVVLTASSNLKEELR